MKRILFLALVCAHPLASLARSPAREILTFTITTNVGFGNEVFIAGSHGDVGQWDPTKAAKLFWTTGNVWTGQVGVQSGTALDYKPVAMPNSYTGICNPANAQWIPPGNGNHLTTNAPAQPAAPYVGKTIYYHSGFTNAYLIYSTDGVHFATSPMTNIGPGRAGSEKLYHISGVGEAGEGLQFIPWDGGTNYDHAPYPGYGGGDYYTALDVCFLQDGNIFNYFPPATLSAPRIINSNAVSTHAPSPSRTMRIYLPRGYDQNSTWKRYPVVYMHDGENVFSPASIASWGAETTATKETSQGRMREVIIVGLNSSGALRTREYLPPEDNSGGAGFGDVYCKFLVYDVKTNIDTEFKTLRDRPNTLTIGASSGGLITTYLGWATNVFGKIGPFSPAYLISPNFNNRINVEPKQPLRIFTETGNVDYPETAILPDTWTILDYFLKDGYVQNVDLVSRLGCGQAHGESAWADWLPECYRFLLNLLDEPNWLAQRDYPPRITNATPQAASFMTLNSRTYRLEWATNLLSSVWQRDSTSTVERLPWANRSLSLTNNDPNSPGVFLRVVAE